MSVFQFSQTQADNIGVCGDWVLDTWLNYITWISYLVINSSTWYSYYSTGIWTGFRIDLNVSISWSVNVSWYNWSLSEYASIVWSETWFIVWANTWNEISLFGMWDSWASQKRRSRLTIQITSSSWNTLWITWIVLAKDNGLFVAYPTSDVSDITGTILSLWEVYLWVAGYYSGVLYSHTGVGFDAFGMDYTEYYIWYDWDNDSVYDFTGLNQSGTHTFATGNQTLKYAVSIANSEFNLEPGVFGHNVLFNTIYLLEQCDDGNTSNGDWCSSQCLLEEVVPVIPPVVTNNSAWWGGGWFSNPSDNCTLPWSILTWANLSGIDYSPSYYDDTCEGRIVVVHASANEVDNGLNESYLWAYENGITNKTTFQKAKLEWKLLRYQLAKMISIFAMDLVWKIPDTEARCVFTDISNQDLESRGYIKTACQLWLMGLKPDGTMNSKFHPNSVVNVAQLWTILSRLIWWGRYNWWSPWYRPHLNKIKTEGILTGISLPRKLETRWRVIMMMKNVYEDVYINN